MRNLDLGTVMAFSALQGIKMPYMPKAGQERAKRSAAVSTMLIEKAQAKRERKAAIRAARATA